MDYRDEVLDLLLPVLLDAGRKLVEVVLELRAVGWRCHGGWAWGG